MNEPEFAGIRRFHRVTISAGIVFCGLMVARFVLSYSRTHDSLYLTYTGLAVLAGVALSVYLVRFWKTGLE